MIRKESQYKTNFLENAQPVGWNSELARRGDHVWRINDSSFSEYAKVEFPNYPGGLLQILDQRIGRNKANMGADLAGGSQGYALGDLVKEGVIGGGLVTNLENRRFIGFSPYRELDHIAGDLATEAVWNKIMDWQQQNAPQGLALVMHRPYGGLQDQPPEVYVGAMHLLLDMLRPGGVLFSQIPSPLIDTSDALVSYREIYSRSDVDEIIIGESKEEHARYSVVARYFAVVTKVEDSEGISG